MSCRRRPRPKAQARCFSGEGWAGTSALQRRDVRPCPPHAPQHQVLPAWFLRPCGQSFFASPGSGLAPCGSCSGAATVATVAAAASRPTSAALGAVVSTGPEPMTGQGQSASGSSVWSTVFRHVRYENLVAGVSGGVLSNLALHPLDLVKIRFAGKSLPRPRGAFLAASTDWVVETQNRGVTL